MNKRLLIISGIIVLLILAFIFFPGQECGRFTTTIPPLDQIECSCIGFKSTGGMIGGGPIYCKGICLKSTCKTPDYVYDQIEQSFIDLIKVSGEKLVVERETKIEPNQKSNTVHYALQNQLETPTNFKIQIECNGQIYSEQEQSLSANEIKADKLTFSLVANELTSCLINIFNENNELYDSKTFFITFS